MTDTKYYLCNAYRDAIIDQYVTNMVKANVNNFVISRLRQDVWSILQFECKLNVYNQFKEDLLYTSF